MAEESSELQVSFKLQAEDLKHLEESFIRGYGTLLCYPDTASPTYSHLHTEMCLVLLKPF